MMLGLQGNIEQKEIQQATTEIRERERESAREREKETHIR